MRDQDPESRRKHIPQARLPAPTYTVIALRALGSRVLILCRGARARTIWVRSRTTASDERAEKEKGERAPEPAALDEEDIEDVAFARKVRGRGVVGLEGLRDRTVDAVVVRRAQGRGEVGEGGAEEESQGVD